MSEGRKPHDAHSIACPPAEKRPIQKTTFFDIFNILFAALFALIILYPFYNCILISVTPQHIYAREPFMPLSQGVEPGESYYVVFENRVLLRAWA